MLISVNQLIPGDLIVTIGHPSGVTIKSIERTAGGSVKFEYDNGSSEWYCEYQIVFKRDSANKH